MEVDWQSYRILEMEVYRTERLDGIPVQAASTVVWVYRNRGTRYEGTALGRRDGKLESTPV